MYLIFLQFPLLILVFSYYEESFLFHYSLGNKPIYFSEIESQNRSHFVRGSSPLLWSSGVMDGWRDVWRKGIKNCRPWHWSYVRPIHLHTGLGRRFCERYEVALARIQILANLISNESLKPRGSRFDNFFVKFLNLLCEIFIWRWKSVISENSLVFDKK